jgi:ATP phosphoribosyltransferase
MISNPHSVHQDMISLVKRRMEGYITATKYVMLMYNVSNELMDKALVITPGKRSPTVTNLSCGNVKAVSSLVLKKEVSEKMDALHDIGATDILVLDLQNSRM